MKIFFENRESYSVCEIILSIAPSYSSQGRKSSVRSRLSRMSGKFTLKSKTNHGLSLIWTQLLYLMCLLKGYLMSGMERGHVNGTDQTLALMGPTLCQ